jgi:hypothetical protein
MSDIDRDELRRLLAEATPGPWVAEVSGTTGPVVMDAQSVSAFDHVAKCPHYRGSADSELIAAAVNALPDLLDALEKAEGHRDSLAATLIEVQRERLGLEAAVERVRALHGLCRTCDPARDPHCDCCDEDWPCLTISALHGGE